jgi:glycosyltransferase involved in cell wall biosynthesis
MQVSVIIPVYNAEEYVTKAVESAMLQIETGEILLIEDCSPDNSLKICLELERKYEKVRLLRHPNGQNKGAGASRNLGMLHAQFDYIAFLDADDYFLPDRFSVAEKIFKKYRHIDGVYEAIGMHFYDESAKEQWLGTGGELLTTMQENVDPNKLFEQLVDIGKGYIHLDGLVIKRKLIKESGLFFEHLRLHQDTAFITQLAAVGYLVPGRLDTPVALRGIHAENRITHNKNAAYTRLLLWEALFEWSQTKNLNRKRLLHLYIKALEASYQYYKMQNSTNMPILAALKQLTIKFAHNPQLFLVAAASSIRKRLLLQH